MTQPNIGDKMSGNHSTSNRVRTSRLAVKVPSPSSSGAQHTVLKLLRDRIASGYYEAGEWLPTERILSEDLNVDRRVVRSAINQLVRDGLAERRPHCRPIVSEARREGDESREAADPSMISASRFIALIMCHGGDLEQQSGTSQQRVFWGINRALAEFGYHTVFLDLGKIEGEEDNARREAAHLQYVMDRGFGGAIFYPYAYRYNQSLLQELVKTTPLVMIDRQVASVETDFVGTANYQAMYDIVMHLMKLGHRRIAYATKYELIRPVQERIQGYIDAAHGAKIDELVLQIPSHHRDQNWFVVDSIFRLPAGERPTAVVAFNDYAASDLVYHLTSLGLSIPEDVALAGFDNIIPTLPNGMGLTTVAQPYEEIGEKAAQLLLRRLNDPAAPLASLELPGKLIVRESSAAKSRA